MRTASARKAALLAALLSTPSLGLELNVDDAASVKQVASTVAHGMMTWYSGNETGQTPGLLPDPYYWWQAGAMMYALIDYWYYTGDDTYNDITIQAMVHQSSPTVNFMPPNQTKTEGNDDQGFWGMAAMEAAEVKFPNPPDEDPQWLELAQGVFNSQVPRWDTATCAGGLKWQIFTWNNGYNYKNTISNGCFFNLAARLGAYTKNETYFEWARKSYDWLEDMGLIAPQGDVYDGTDDRINCTEINHIQWSYNAGIFLYSSAVMWNQTEGAEQALWQERVNTLLNATTRVFFTNGVMYEAACEPGGNCNNDQVSFKAYLSRWMAATTKLAPFTIDTIMPLIRSSSLAAVKACSGGADGVTCGIKWTTGSWDGTSGPGQQMSVLEVVQSNLVGSVAGPVSNETGGTSRGDYSAGTGSIPGAGLEDPISTGDRAGAGILTAFVLVGILGGAWWMVA